MMRQGGRYHKNNMEEKDHPMVGKHGVVEVAIGISLPPSYSSPKPSYAGEGKLERSDP